MTDGPDLAALPAGSAVRDRVVDVALFGVAVLLGMVAFGVAKEQGDLPGWAVELDPLLGLAACLALWWRRRHPLAVAVIGLPAVALATSALPAGAVIVASLALRVRWRRALQVLGVYLVSVVPSGLLLSGAEGSPWFDAAFSLAYLLAAFAWGHALRSRRLLVERLRADAERARADHERRLAEARRGERQAIAREMHDVLAHRISLLSVHAGALAYRTRQAQAHAGPALSSAEVAQSAEVIRGNAHEAVNELQEVRSCCVRRRAASRRRCCHGSRTSAASSRTRAPGDSRSTSAPGWPPTSSATCGCKSTARCSAWPRRV
jgi:signal transduction histidine kinase